MVSYSMPFFKRTVDNWLSRSRPIPSAKLALIKKLMIEYGHVPFVEQNTFNLEDITSISCTIPPHLRERFEKAAQLENISLEELLRRAVIKESNVILSSQSDSLDE